MDVIAKAHSGAMVCLYLPEEVQRSLAFEGGEEPGKLHVTICYIPGIASDPELIQAVRDAIVPVAMKFGPVKGRIGGIGRFNGSPSSDGKDVYYASYNSPGLTDLRNAVAEALEDAGFVLPGTHGFTPHVTLKYMDMDEPTPPHRQQSGEFQVPALSIAAGDEKQHIQFAQPVAKAEPGSSEVHVPVPLKSKKKAPKKKQAALPVDESQKPAEPAAPPAPSKATDRSRQIVTPEVNNLDVEILKGMDEWEVMPDPATADDAQPAFDSDEYDEMPSDVLIALGSLDYYFGDAPQLTPDNGEEVDEDDEEGEGLNVMDKVKEALMEMLGVEKAVLTEQGRDQVKDSNFALPEERRYPIHDTTHARNALSRSSGKPEEAKVKAAIYQKYPDLTPAKRVEKMLSVERLVPVMKADPVKKIVYGVVLVPDEVDAQGDWMTSEEIEKTAHEYMVKSRAVGKNHKQIINALPVESYIAPVDFEVDGGPYGSQLVKKGSWVLGTRIVDEAEWKKVLDGTYTGYSIGGMGRRT